VTRRLEEMAEEGNGRGKRAFLLYFSLGIVTAEAWGDKSLDELIAAADLIMYEHKREKKAKARTGCWCRRPKAMRGEGDSEGTKQLDRAPGLGGVAPREIHMDEGSRVALRGRLW
jgi:hypothetical protein